MSPIGDHQFYTITFTNYNTALQAIFDILKKYNWLEFSILASADDYGINGIVYLQYLATRDSNFNIRLA